MHLGSIKFFGRILFLFLFIQLILTHSVVRAQGNLIDNPGFESQPISIDWHGFSVFAEEYRLGRRLTRRTLIFQATFGCLSAFICENQRPVFEN